MITLLTEPLGDAIRSLGNKRAIASVMNTAQWEALEVGIRNRAFWSATVEDQRYLDALQRNIQGYLKQEPGYDRSGFVRDMQEMADMLKLRPDVGDSKRGGLQDVGSVRRLNLIWKTNLEMAEGYALYQAGLQTLDLYPFQELIRVESREVPREWLRIWQAAGGVLKNGRMIAHKLDDIWVRISRFGNPWPPYDFNSGMGLREVSKKEGVQLGLDPNPGTLKQPVREFNDGLSTGTAGMTDDALGAIRSQLGDAVRHEASNNKLIYTGQDIDPSRIARMTFDAAEEIAGVVAADFIPSVAGVLARRKESVIAKVENLDALKKIANKHQVALEPLRNGEVMISLAEAGSNAVLTLLKATAERQAAPAVLVDDKGQRVTMIRSTSRRSFFSRVREAMDAFGKILRAA